MSHEEAARAARLVKARSFVAMHWGTFRLTDEPIGEPPELARRAWKSEGCDDEALWILDVVETRRLS